MPPTATRKDAATVGSSDWVRFQAEVLLNGADSEYPYSYVREVFADRIVVESGYANLIEIPYAIEGSELALTLESAREVQLSYVPKSGSPVLTGPIIATKAGAEDGDKRLAYAAVLVPGEPDSDGDVVTAEKVEEVAHDWLADYRQIDLMHSLSPADAEVVESYVTTADMTVGEYDLPAGTWVMASRINNDAVWGAIKSGDLNGYSIMGVRRAALKSVVDAATKSEAGVPLALKRTLLSDLGDDWICPFVSIVDAPAVPKAKFFALKSAASSEDDAEQTSQTTWKRILSAVRGKTSDDEEEVATKAGRKFSDKTYQRMKDAHAALGDLVGEAESEREEKAAKKQEEDSEMNEEQMAKVLEAALKPLHERLDKLEAAPAASDDDPDEAEKSEETDAEQAANDARDARISELESELAELKEGVAKRLKPATKSRALRSDANEDAANPDAAEKSGVGDRDIYGRARNKPHSIR